MRRGQIRYLLLGLIFSLCCQTSEISLPYQSKTSPISFKGVNLIHSPQLLGDMYGESIAVSKGAVIVGASGAERAFVFAQIGSIWKQQDILSPFNITTNKLFGKTLALDGDTALVGYSGYRAYLFQRKGIAWEQKQTLTANTGKYNGGFGTALAIDGNTIIVGAYATNNVQGAAYVYVQSGTSWTQQAKLTSSGSGKSDWFGKSVSLSGNTAAVGSIAKKAYIFSRMNSTWQVQQTLDGSSWSGGQFWGTEVSVSGRTLAVGDNSNNYYDGAVFIFSRQGAVTVQ